MSRRAQENLIAIAFLIVFVSVIVLCLDYGVRARKVPLPLAIFGLALIVIQIIWQNLRSTDELHVDLLKVITKNEGEEIADKASEGGEPAATEQSLSRRTEGAALGVVAVILGLILLVGPIPAICLFTGGYFLLSRHYSWLKSIVYTLVFTAVVYLLFVVALEVELYHGILGPVVEQWRLRH